MLTLYVKLPDDSESQKVELENTKQVKDLKETLKLQQKDCSGIQIQYCNCILEDSYMLHNLPFVPVLPVLTVTFTKDMQVVNEQKNNGELKKLNDLTSGAVRIVQLHSLVKTLTFKQKLLAKVALKSQGVNQVAENQFIENNSVQQIDQSFQQSQDNYQLVVNKPQVEGNNLNAVKYFCEIAPNTVVNCSKQKIQFFYANLQRQNSLRTIDNNHPSIIMDVQEEERNLNNETVLDILNDFDQEKSPAKQLSIIKQQGAQDLVRRMNEQRQDMDKRRQQLQEEQERQWQQEKQQEREQRLLELDEGREQKRKMIQQKLEEDRQRRLQKINLNKQGDKVIQKVKKEIEEQEKELQRKNEEEIKRQMVERKKILEEKKQQHKPISLNQIREHQKKHDEDLNQLKIQRQRDRIENEIMQRQSSMPKQSKFTILVQQEDKAKKDQFAMEKEQKKQLMLRKMKYADVVKDMFVPQKKRQSESVEQHVQQVERKYETFQVRNNNSRSPKEQSSREMMSTKNTVNSNQGIKLQAFRSNGNLRKVVHTQFDNEFIQDEKQKQIPASKLPPVIRRKQNIIVPKPPEPEPIKKTDYLGEMKRKRQDALSQNKTQDWEIVFNQEQKSVQRLQTIKTTVHKLENQAKQKEKLAICLNDIDKEDEANTLYIQSIKAKLAYLSSYNK